MPDPGPNAAVTTFDFDRDPPRLALMETLYTAQNPDLTAFRNRGGKLILYHGWDDAEIPPALMLRYFETMQRTMGGPKSTREFARLFMLPGVAHCRRGPGADTADWLTYLERWVEEGQEPGSVDTYHLTKQQNYLGLPRPRFPLPAADHDRVKTLQPLP
jgi:feruloyl esterase